MSKTADTINEAIKAAPPVGVGGLNLFGYPLPDVVQVLTIVWLLFLILTKLPEVASVLDKIGAFFKKLYDR